MRAALVGMKFRPPALDTVERLPDGTELLLVREPGNTHDHNAVAVYFKLGFIPRTAAAKLAPLLDKQVSGLVGMTKAQFQYHPQWPQLEIADDPSTPPPAEPPVVKSNSPLDYTPPPMRGPDDEEIPF